MSDREILSFHQAIEQQYHAHPSVSKTKLNHFATSTLDYWHYHVAKDIPVPPPKKHMVVGSAVHDVLLEGGCPDQRIAIYPEDCLKSNGAINPKPSREFEQANADRYVMKEDAAEIVRLACEAVREHELGALVSHPEAVFEKPIFWTCPHTGLECRAKPDFYLDMGDRILAYDLKTTEQIYPAAFARTAKQFRYWLQDAHYSTGLRTIFEKPVEFRFWVVEVKRPFRISPREYDPPSREIADDAYKHMMERLAQCYQTNEWRDEWTRKTTFLTLGPWDVESSDELEFEDANAA